MVIPTIPERLHGEIRAKCAEDLSTREISAWLLAEHQLEISHTAVGDFLANDRAERAPLAREIVRTELKYSPQSDFRLSQGLWDAITALEQKAAAMETKKLKASTLDLMRLIKLQADLIGAKGRLLAHRTRFARLPQAGPADIASVLGQGLVKPQQAPEK